MSADWHLMWFSWSLFSGVHGIGSISLGLQFMRKGSKMLGCIRGSDVVFYWAGMVSGRILWALISCFMS